MKPETISLLCSPITHEPLRLESVPDPEGRLQDVLVSVSSGERFPIREGIPVFLDETRLAGYNRQYLGFYNKVARFYDPTLKVFGLLVSGGEEKFRREFLDELEMKEASRLLEVSVGTGANLHYLPTSIHCFGLDLSWAMLQQCRKNLPHWKREAELFLGDAEELPFQDNYFDVVFHMGGINVFNDRARAIREMIRVARSGTKIVIVDETAHLMKKLSWFPGIKRMLRDYQDRFDAPVGLVPPSMQEINVRQIDKGMMYCLSFRKPW